MSLSARIYQQIPFWLRNNLLLLAVFLVTILLTGQIKIDNHLRQTKQNFHDESVQITRNLARSVARPLYNFDRETLRQILLTSFDKPQVITTLVQEKVVAIAIGYQRQGRQILPITTLPETLKSTETSWHQAQVSIRYKGAVLGQMIVQYSDHLLIQETNQFAKGVWQSLAIMAAICMVLLNAFAWFYLELRKRLDTERKKLVENEARYRAVAGQKGQIVYDYVIETGTISWYGDIEMMTGYTVDEFQFFDIQRWEESIFVEDRAATLELLEKALQDQTQYQCSYRFHRKDETTIFIEDSGIFSAATQDGHTHMLGIMRDVSLRRNAESEVEHLQNLMSNIINSMPSVIAGVNRDGCIMQWNSGAEELTGISPEEAKGRPLTDLLPQLHSQLNRIHQVIESRSPHTDRKIPTLSAKGFFYSDLTIYPLTANGIEGAVIRMDDVTDRVRIEEMMVQSEKMLSVGGLAAGMAHEINNPLAGILQSIQVIQNRLSPQLEKNQQAAAECGITLTQLCEYLGKRDIDTLLDSISESSKRAAHIIENMLDFSRHSEQKRTPHDLRKIIDQAVDLAANDYDLKKKYDFRQIEIKREFPDTLSQVVCESGQIQQVLLNLLRNAAQAMHECQNRQKPQIILRLNQDTDQLKLDICDNGPGMHSDVQRRAFEPFFTTKEVGIGTGLGLSVSYFIITENHQGHLSVLSQPGQGTCFTITLPLDHKDWE